MADPKPSSTTTTTTSTQPNTPSTSSSTPTSPSPTPTVTDFLPSDTLSARFKNFYRMATGKMSPEGAKQYWEDADRRYSELDCKRCEQQRDYLLKFSPIIRYLGDNIRKLGGDLGSHNIRCRTCKTGQLGGFDHKYGILICANWVEKQNMLEDVLAHEMVHAYDHLRFKTNLSPEDDLRHAACSEIRASNLSGECRWSNEFFRNKIVSFTNHHQDCVRRRAILSVKSRPNCKDDVQAVKVVNEVWDSCFRDTRPFDEIYR
ncbi:Mitochondrial inner membrane protease atp23 [Exophiala dermatitidis]